MALISIGCAGLPPRMTRDAYFEVLGYLESDALRSAAPPKGKALRRWREAAPEGAGFGLLAPDLQLNAPSTDELADLAKALGVEVVVLRTPPAITPAHKDELEAALSDATELMGPVAWEPQGLWEPIEAARIAERCGVMFAFDPIAHDPLRELDEAIELATSGGRAYFRITGLGHSGRTDLDDLEALAEITGDLDRAWVVFATPNKLQDAKRFRALTAELASG